MSSPAAVAPGSLRFAAIARALRQAAAWLTGPMSAQRAALLLAAYLALAANWPLWLQLAHIDAGPRAVLALLLLLLCGTVALLCLTAWPRVMKPLWWLAVLVAALSQHYMLAYGVVIDPGMAGNMLHTDPREVADLLGPRLLIDVLVVLALPTWWLWRVRIAPRRLPALAARNAGLLLLALGVAAGTVAALSRDLAPLMRNHTQLRYQMNPLAGVYSTTVAAARAARPAGGGVLVPTSQGAALGATHAAGTRPPLLVLVVGETARADHFGLNGYGRDTTPELARRQVLSWRQVRSCGTSTLASVPCMFSPLGKRAFESRKQDYENLLDVAQAAGLAVLWVENQDGGCKGVCERVPHVRAADGLPDATRQALCAGGECSDEAMLAALDARLAALPEARRQNGVLLVMHQMGSHGPAYYKRSLPAAKRFLPECRTEVLADCSQADLLNAFDNTIAATDAFLAHTIDWLRGQSARYDTGLLYVSDHGESLGEYGLFLHGMPYAIAPDQQKHVPMVAWLGAGLERRQRLSDACLRAGLDAPLTHDNLYHTVLGLLDVQSPSYQRTLDALAGCRGVAPQSD